MSYKHKTHKTFIYRIPEKIIFYESIQLKREVRFSPWKGVHQYREIQ